MSTEHKYISSITPETQKWTAKVRVMEKSSLRTAMQSSQKYQRLILIDAQGMRVQATIFGNDIESLASTLYILGHYYISNAVVRPIEEQHRIVNNKYQWTISTKTPIREVPEGDLNGRLIATPFNLVTLSELSKHTSSRAPVDILAAVVDIYPKKTIKENTTLQEILLTDHKMQPTKMTLWDDFVRTEGAYISQFLDSYPIILATRLKVTSFNGVTLSTKSSSTFLLNPQIPESQLLQEWITQNKERVKTSLQNQIVTPASTTLKLESTNTVIPIKSLSLSTANTDATFWVKATASIKDQTQKLWYMRCNTCWNGIHADYNDKFQCWKCKQERTTQPRCCFAIQLSDETGYITATIFGDNAEKLFQINAMTLMETESANNKMMEIEPSTQAGKAKSKRHENATTPSLATSTTPTEYYFHLKLSKKQDQFQISDVTENPPQA